MKTTKTVILSLFVGGLIGFIIGHEVYLYGLKHEIDKTEQIGKMQLSVIEKNSYILISTLESIDANNFSKAKEIIINKLGQTYYNWAYLNKRDINPPEIERILKKIENLSHSSNSFYAIKNYQKTELAK